MEVFLAALVLVGLCVFGMCFNIIFRRKEFPKYDVGSNEEMRKRGIRCFKDEDAAIHGRKCKAAAASPDGCSECGLCPGLTSDGSKSERDNP